MSVECKTIVSLRCINWHEVHLSHFQHYNILPTFFQLTFVKVNRERNELYERGRIHLLKFVSVSMTSWQLNFPVLVYYQVAVDERRFHV